MEHIEFNNYHQLSNHPDLICNVFEKDVSYLFGRGVATTKFVAGAEMEIEQVSLTPKAVDWCNGKDIVIEEDGSLRDNGKEFLLPPSREAALAELFAEFHTKAPIKYGSAAFSRRTSTHVHVNVNFMTRPQVKTFMLLYSIFEPLAFQYCGDHRRTNIHCVPLSYTHLPSLYGMELSSLINKWSKYTALNLIPIKTLGTVEFRHLGGTNNPEVFSTWLGFLSTLYEEAIKIGSFRQILLKPPYSYLKKIEERLLTPEFVHFAQCPIEFVLEDNLLNVKLQYL